MPRDRPVVPRYFPTSRSETHRGTRKAMDPRFLHLGSAVSKDNGRSEDATAKTVPKNPRKRYAHETHNLSRSEFPRITPDTVITAPTHSRATVLRKKRKIETITTITVTEEVVQGACNVDLQQLKEVVDASIAPILAQLKALEKRIKETETSVMSSNKKRGDKDKDDDSVTFIETDMVKKVGSNDDRMAPPAPQAFEGPSVAPTGSHHGREAKKPTPRRLRSSKNCSSDSGQS